MTEELKPCPFCGGEDAFVEQSTFASSYVICNNCMARGPDSTQDSDDEDEPGRDAAITAWNTRLSHSAEKQALIEALEKIAAKDFVSAEGEWAVQIARSTLLSMRNNGHG